MGLYPLPLIFERLNFQMGRLRKELVNELGVTILTSCVYCMTYETRIYLIYQKIEKMKKFALQCPLKCGINICCFDEEARWCASHFVEILSKNEQTMKL